MSPLPDFLQPLEYYTSPFPRAAMEAAIERKEESIPHLLEALEWVIENPDEANETEPIYTLHVYAMYLLAYFREPRALPLVSQLFHLDQYEALTGDVVLTGLPRILASTGGSDISPIKALIEDVTADDLVRGSGVQALGVLLHCGLRSREEIVGYFSELLEQSEDDPDFDWDSIITVAVDLRLTELIDKIRTLYGTVGDLMIESLEEVEEAIAFPQDPSDPALQEYNLIDDPITDLEILARYDDSASSTSDDDYLTERYEPTLPGLDYLGPEEPGIPHIRETPKVGRNDLCPCGSGKKYKKCCGATDIS